MLQTLLRSTLHFMAIFGIFISSRMLSNIWERDYVSCTAMFAGALGLGFISRSKAAYTGIVAGICTLLILMGFGDVEILLNIFSVEVLIAGLLTGIFLHRRHYYSALILGVLATVSLIAFYLRSGRPETEALGKHNMYAINGYQMIRNANGRSIHLSTDTVYLLNFTSHFCRPCRLKHSSLRELTRKFGKRPFKVITIHSIDDTETFLTYSGTDPHAFHDEKCLLSKEFGVEAYPTELIVDRKGKVTSRIVGFQTHWKREYIDGNSEIINAALSAR